ncbi:MAG: vitamin B12-dependent ribonucleotide reductase, partial [Kiritimatiellae bacterium]|nr:vitamin B12-dependent ribonucleotide reductase [Kiritimatiellia bacterium]
MDQPGQGKGLRVGRMLTQKGTDPFDKIEWERRTALITDDKGKVIFVQDNVEVPKSWSMLATNVVASKYFYGPMGGGEREYSVRQLIHRVARTITDWGVEAGYFAGHDEAEAFYDELAAICV